MHHIWISPYNSQANGVVEQRHYNVREAIVKSCKGVESHWPHTIHSVFWAKRITILQSTGLSPYFMAHGVEPLFPFNLAEATFLVLLLDADSSSTSDLIAWHACQLQKCQEDLDTIRDRVLKACFTSIKHFEAMFKSQIKDFDFRPGSLILVRNSKFEKELNRKTKPRYLGPMVVLHQTTGGSYVLAELDGSVSKLCFAAFCIVPYYPRFCSSILVMDLSGFNNQTLDALAAEDNEELDDEDSEPGGSD